jgi:CrcB protein
MQTLFLVGFGGALGAVSRYWINTITLAQFNSSLLGTFFANTSGSFALGLFVGLLTSHPTWPLETRLFVAVGFLGSYTTFSTLSVATVQSLQKGDIFTAAINIGASVVLGLLAAFIGILIGRAL